MNEKEVVDELATFDNIWDSLNSREQARLLNVLIERIGYDGSTGKVSITFKSLEIKEMVNGKGGGEKA